ncbi:hypothetical protein B7P43_G15582 [Cryptotermes secundus]|uniref:Platelet-derived growth factor (PDGF) family profile domain-containing protein n=1 Tax=Cryptotermes secundus TaxID=105785 RepID=A0A2J7QIQ8_9NEOP|nr:hypothetical protein B7P43_G15582 [Cryptotermes secundus]
MMYWLIEGSYSYMPYTGSRDVQWRGRCLDERGSGGVIAERNRVFFLHLQDITSEKQGEPHSEAGDTDLAKAVQHALTVSREGQCRVPKPRLIQVKDVYPHPSKTYIPHCTILHLCGDDTGCCKSDTLTCIARKTEQVDLYFYVGVVSFTPLPPYPRGKSRLYPLDRRYR